MSRWLKNVNALLENLDSQVEDTVEEHRFNRTLSAAARKGGADGRGEEGELAAVEGLLQEEAQGVDDILAKRGLLGGDDDDGDDDDNAKHGGGDEFLGDDAGTSEADNTAQANANVKVGQQATEPEEQQDDSGADTKGDTTDKTGSEDVGSDVGLAGDDALSEEIKFDDTTPSGHGEQKQDLFGDATDAGDIVTPTVPVSKGEDSSEDVQSKGDAPTSSGVDQGPVIEGKASEAPAEQAPAKPKQQQAPSSSNVSASTTKSSSSNNSNNIASLKELRKLRRHVLQLNSDLESAEREIDAQRQELDRAASRMERDRSRHKQEKESTDATHKAEIAALVAAHERAIQQLKEANEGAMQEMEGRVARAEQQRAKEGGERDAELADALERERASVSAMARLQEEKTTMNERITSLTTEVSRLETRLEHATSQMDLASERERNAEEQLDKALSLHARQLGVRQKRESELEQTVADLGAALVVAKNKVEAAMKAGVNFDGDGMANRSNSSNLYSDEDPMDLKARLQDSQDEIETLRAQLGLERQRCSTLHSELQDLSKEQADELSGAHAKQRQYERKISDLTTTVAKLQSSLRRAAGGADDVLIGNADTDAAAGEDTSSSGMQYSGDVSSKETDHLRKQIASLSEKIFEQQSKIDNGRGEISTLKNRLRSAALRAETAEKSLEVANQRLIMMDAPTSGMSSADEEMGLQGRRATKKRRPVGASAQRRGFQKASKVESIRSALGLHPGRFPSGGWQEMVASLLDTFDTLAVDLGSHFRHYPMSRLAFMMYMLMLHLWAFFLLVYHAHAQGTGTGDHYGPESLLKSYRHMEQAGAHSVAGAAVAADTP